MYPAQFEYEQATSFGHAVELLAAGEGDAKLLSGGCSLIPLLKLRLAQPARVIDLNRIPDAGYIHEEGGWLRVGALARESDVETSSLVADRYPILVDVTSVIADPLVRNRGTLAGNLAHGDPANDHPAVAVVLQARMVVQGSGGTREIEAGEFFRGLFETALRNDDVLVEVRFPAPAAGSGAAYVKFERQAGDFPMAAAAASVRLDGDRIVEAGIALTNVGPVPYRPEKAEALLKGAAAGADVLDAAAEESVRSLALLGDLRLSGESKLHLSRVAVRRALEKAIARAAGDVT